ncbi:MAG TPA: M48 family metallopeptidase [Terriglobales bacterium]|jgi:predicted Zn-dependent protease|nr:M48 family metallopeptidase [Terriglobales bacterium]
MKIRLTLLAAALATFGFVTPRGFAQNPGSTDPNTRNPNNPTQTVPNGPTTTQAPTTPPTLPPTTASPDDSGKDDSKPKETPIQAADPDKVKHDGGKDDVDAIGNRKMGKRGLGNWYSVEGEIRMGKQYAQQVESSSKMVNDPVITEYVNRVGQNLVRNSDSQVPFTIKVIDSDEINAFALPGGYFYVNSGLILAADDEAELAGVMAHEIAHVAARHATRQMTRSQWANIGTIPLIFMGGGLGYAIRGAAGIGLPMTFLTFQRGFEAEADYLGLQYMYKTGYDPQAFVSFFEKIQAQEKKKPGTLAKAFSTHPQTPDRITKSQEEIEKILPARPQYLVTSSEFDEVKARLASLENRRKMIDDKDSKKPTLRRASTTEKTGKEDKTSDDDRPTLKRRDDQN